MRPSHHPCREVYRKRVQTAISKPSKHAWHGGKEFDSHSKNFSLNLVVRVNFFVCNAHFMELNVSVTLDRRAQFLTNLSANLAGQVWVHCWKLFQLKVVTNWCIFCREMEVWNAAFWFDSINLKHRYFIVIIFIKSKAKRSIISEDLNIPFQMALHIQTKPRNQRTATNDIRSFLISHQGKPQTKQWATPPISKELAKRQPRWGRNKSAAVKSP